MPFNILLLPLLGGYIFLRFFIPTKPWFLRQERYQLLIYASLAGMFFLVCAFIITTIDFDCSFLQSTSCWWQYHVPFDHLGKSMIAFALGILCLILNIPIYYLIPLDFKRMAMLQYRDILELLFEKSVSDAKLVSITLKNNKVYIGIVTRYPEPHTKGERFVSILPIFSGYRDKETKRLAISTDYLAVYDELEELQKADPSLDTDDFDIIIPISEILSINIYSLAVSDLFDNIDAAPRKESEKLSASINN